MALNRSCLGLIETRAAEERRQLLIRELCQERPEMLAPRFVIFTGLNVAPWYGNEVHGRRATGAVAPDRRFLPIP